MKSFTISIVAILLFSFSTATAQKSGPAPRTVGVPASNAMDPSTNCQLRYYYFPNLEAYFDTKKNIYHYMQNGKWLTAESLPNGYKGYSLYKNCKIAITNYDDEDPTQFLKQHKKQFPYAANGKIKNMMAVAD